MRRRRISSVPVGVMIVALAAIALLAFVAFYVGDSDVSTRFVDQPMPGSESGNH